MAATLFIAGGKMSDTATVGDLDVQIFEKLFENFGEPCSFGKCENKATWMLLCPYDRNAETVCDEHRAEMLSWDDDNSVIFDGTCGHRPDIGSCTWEPYS